VPVLGVARQRICYWCEQAGTARYPLPAPTAEAAQAASRKELHKKRCQGVTVFR